MVRLLGQPNQAPSSKKLVYQVHYSGDHCMRAKRTRHPFYEPPCTFFNELCYPDTNADILAAYEVFRKRRDKHIRSVKIAKIAAWRRLVLSRLEHHQISYVDAYGEIVVYKGIKAALAELQPGERRKNMVAPYHAILVELSHLFAGVGCEVYTFMVDDAYRSGRGVIVGGVREWILAAATSKKKYPKAMQPLERGIKWGWEWLHSLSDEELLSLGLAAADVLDGCDFMAIRPGDCDLQIGKMQEYAQSIYPHLQASIKEHAVLADRLHMWEANVNENIDSLENQEGISGLWILAKQGTFAFSAEIWGEIGRTALVAYQRHQIQESPFDDCMCFAFSQWFWYIAIYQILARHGAIEKHRITEWGKRLLHEVWNHPSKLNRVTVDPAGAKCRTALCKMIAPCVREFMSCKHATELRREFDLVKDTSDEIKDISIRLLCAFSLYNGTRDQGQTGRLKKVICDLLESYILPYVDEIMGYLFRCMDADPSDIDVMMLEIIAEAAEENDAGKGFAKLNAAIEAARAKRDASIGLEIEDAVAEDLVPGEEQAYTWYWVDNTNRPINKAVSLSWSSFEDDSTFSDAVSGTNIKCPIDPEGLLSALLHYEQMDLHQQVTLRSEEFNGRKWHKLKRGDYRILLRKESGKTFVHAYRRKNWVAPGVLR
jgi:hypothetical protein